jgi:uncharacterized membrane protein YoaK (UPF0700 family)
MGFILSFTAGFADTLTFTTANGLFSAHVTGNFVVLAYDVVSGAEIKDWIKLVSFPVFLLGVVLAGMIANKNRQTSYLLFLEGIILTLVGIMIIAIHYLVPQQQSGMDFFFILIIVFAMAFQNAFGRISIKTTFAPTTVMTGNVTQVTLDIVSGIYGNRVTPNANNNITQVLKIILAFLIGCITGGLLGSLLGTGVIILPGILIALVSYQDDFSLRATVVKIPS